MQKYGKKLTLDIGNQISLKKINENESAARQKRGNIMIHPSYVELMKVVNNNVEFGEEPVVNSRYSLVLAASKRARQIIAGSEPLVEGAAGKKPLSVAIDELYKGKVKILAPEENEEEETAAQTEEVQAAVEAPEEALAAEAAEETTEE